MSPEMLLQIFLERTPLLTLVGLILMCVFMIILAIAKIPDIDTRTREQNRFANIFLSLSGLSWLMATLGIFLR